MYNDVYNAEQYAYTYGTLLKWLRLKLENQNLSSYLSSHNIKTIAVYGISLLGELLLKELEGSDVKISFFIDKKFRDYEDGIQGIPVYGLGQLPDIQNIDVIIVTPVYYFKEIVKDMLANEVPLEKIISLNMMFP